MKYPYQQPSISGVIKHQPEDFRVFENLGFEPCGEGEHLFLHIEKTNLTTQDLIEQVAREFSVKPRDIGYSGLKDKVAITQQWLSVHLPGQMNSTEIKPSTVYTLLSSVWHNKKIRPGSHQSNSFEVIVRNVMEFSSQAQQQIGELRQYGMANYFGGQRFGIQQDNVDRAIHAFSNDRRTRKLSRTKRGLYLSALRSHLFNEVLSRRIEQEHWKQPLAGDVFMLSGSHSLFSDTISDEILERFAEQDISSAASLYGEGDRKLAGAALALEDEVFEKNPQIIDCLDKQKIKLQMRSTRVTVTEFETVYDEQQETLRIKATLPRGSYFTTLLEHFIRSTNA